MSRRLALVATAAAAGLLAPALAACSVSTPATGLAKPVPVGLTAEVPGRVTIGVEVTLSAVPGEGAEWRDAAEGAAVAARRFTLGGTDVTLVAVNDKGTVDGAAAAVRTLAGRNVSGIVLATSGDHVSGALAAAAAENIPVLMPYDLGQGGAAGRAWSTGPSRRATDERIVANLTDRGLEEPLFVDAGGGSVTGIVPHQRRTFAAGDDPAELARKTILRQQQTNTAVDSVVVSGPPELQAVVVAALQGTNLDLPFVLTPQALSPAFPAALTTAGGSLAGRLWSAGLDDGDATALESSEPGRALAAYFSGLQLTAADPAAKDLFGDRPFAEVAGAADVSSHDAVVALVRAAAAAKSTAPDRVGQALAGLRLGGADGVAGPALDFAGPEAVSDDAVVPLAATSVQPGLRPPSTAPALFWFENARS